MREVVSGVVGRTYVAFVMALLMAVSVAGGAFAQDPTAVPIDVTGNIASFSNDIATDFNSGLPLALSLVGGVFIVSLLIRFVMKRVRA